jgi:hypothetical protein
MNSFLITAGLFFTLSFVHTCNKACVSLEPTDYINWVENADNGFAVTKQLSKYKFELQYKPLEYVVLQDNYGKLFSEKEMKKSMRDIEDMQYFTFRISDENGGDLLRDEITAVEQFSSRLAYFSSEMQKDVKLIESNDTLPCLLFHFERTYGVDPRSTFVLGFPLGKKDGKGGMPAETDKVFLFDDHQLGAGPIYMTISADKINQVPFLKSN